MARLALVLAALTLLCQACDTATLGPGSTPSVVNTSPVVGRPSAPGKPSTAKSRGKVPHGFVRVRVGGITPASNGNAVLLVDDDAQRALVIFVGDTEALSIQLRLSGTKYKRPLTHDLLDNMLSHLGAKVESVRVDRLDNDIYYGVVLLDDGHGIKEFDSRTSDGIALALGSRAPLFVAKEVLDKAGVPLTPDDSAAPSSLSEPERPDPIAL